MNKSVKLTLCELKDATIDIGFVGENLYRTLEIDCAEAYAEYPHAAASMTVQPPQEEAYPAVVERVGNSVVWTLTDSDLAQEGDGEFQLAFTSDEVVRRTWIGTFKIHRSIMPTGNAPSGIDDFLTRAGAALTAIPETIDEELEEAKESGEFDGYSPTVEVTDIPGGHRVSITDVNGTTTVDVMNGEDGEDGYSPTVTVTDIEGGHRVSITDATGTTTFDVMNGATGATPNITIGTVTTGAAGSDASVTRRNGSPDTAPIFDFVIPKGDQGDAASEIIIETHDENDWVYRSYWSVADGTVVYAAGWGRSGASIDRNVVSIEATSPFKLFIQAYENNTYIGTWFGEGFVKTYDSSYILRYIDVDWFRKKYPTYAFKITATKTSGAFTLDDMAENIAVMRSLVRTQKETILNVFGDITRKDIWSNGTVNSTGKIDSDTNYNKRLATLCLMRFIVPVTITPKNGYTISITTYLKDGTFESQFTAWSTNPYTFTDPDKLYRITIKPVSSSEQINPANVGNYIEANILYQTQFDRALSEYSNVKTISHRGYNAIAPENTLQAFELSSKLGYKYVECDVLFTSDGVPVIMHDDTIDRTCCLASDGSAVTGNIAIDSISYSTLISTYDACSAAQWATWKGVKVPTFAEFMYCCKAMNLHAWVELKWTHTYTQSEIQLIISTIKQYGMEEHVSFISFDVDALALVAAEWDTVELGLNGTVSEANSLKTGKNRVFMLFESNVDYSSAISAGFQVCVYTVDTENTLSGLTNNGYDSILTNKLTPSRVSDVIRAKYKSTIS